MNYYRYVDNYYDYREEQEVELEEYEVLSTTECGVWIKVPERNKHFPKFILGKRFVLERSLAYKTSTRKHFAWPTKELALISYIARKEKQIGILEYQLENAKEFLRLAKDLQNDNSLGN